MLHRNWGKFLFGKAEILSNNDLAEYILGTMESRINGK